MVKDNNYVEQLKGMLPQYLDILGVSTKRPFKCLNPNHMDKTPSMSFDAKDGRHVHCFGCGATLDIFDLIAVNELKSPVIDGPDGKPKVEYSFSEAYNKILQVFNVNAKPMTQSEHKQPENERESQLRAKTDEVNAFIVENASKLLSTSEFNQIKNPTPEQRQSHELGLKYLQERGLSPEIAVAILFFSFCQIVNATILSIWSVWINKHRSMVWNLLTNLRTPHIVTIHVTEVSVITNRYW